MWPLLTLAGLGLLLSLISPMLRPLQAMTCFHQSAFLMHDKYRVILHDSEALLEMDGPFRGGDRCIQAKKILN